MFDPQVQKIAWPHSSLTEIITTTNNGKNNIYVWLLEESTTKREVLRKRQEFEFEEREARDEAFGILQSFQTKKSDRSRASVRVSNATEDSGMPAEADWTLILSSKPRR